ncbi:MAG: tyrosine-type recombinase/integrase [Candidatus Bathyarchaeota archaeon]|nr:MAG: tyrosine-type recombinase/integrase [Candidatus Bathyarchaeota archaeon]
MAEIDSMKFWMQQLSNLGTYTVTVFKHYFLIFCKWVGKSPYELIEMKKKALEHNGDRRENMVLEGKVKEFMKYLEEEAVWMDQKKIPQKHVGYGVGTRQIVYAGILSFFALNEYPLNMKRGDRPNGDKIGSRIPEKAELVKLVNAAKSRRHRADILFLKDSGLRLSDVVRLRWSDLEDFGEGFYGFRLITRKKRVKAVSFVGPETTQALEQLPRKKDRIFPIAPKYLSTAISTLISEASLDAGFTAHGLRKYFNTELEAARVPKEYRYAMMGKRVSVYDENRQRRLLKVYRENYDSLRVFGVVEQDELIKRQGEEIKDLKRQLDKVNQVEMQLAQLVSQQKAWVFVPKEHAEEAFTDIMGGKDKAQKALAKLAEMRKKQKS